MKYEMHYSGGCGHLHDSLKEAKECLLRGCIQIPHLNGWIALVRRYELMAEDWEDLLRARTN